MMIRFINNQLVLFVLKSNDEDFECEVTILYRYCFFNIKTINFTLPLDSKTTINSVYKIAKEVITDMDKITKLTK